MNGRTEEDFDDEFERHYRRLAPPVIVVAMVGGYLAASGNFAGLPIVLLLAALLVLFRVYWLEDFASRFSRWRGRE